MRSTHLTALIALTAAGFATAAQAQPRPISNAIYTTDAGKAACNRSFADRQCATYQNRLIGNIALQARNAPRPMSQQAVARRQLDALLATIN